MNLTSSAGAKQWTYDYEPYGGVRSEVKNKPQAPANLLRFAGEYRDTTTTLYHLGARQYDSGTGRFLSADPLPAAWADPYLTTYAYAQDRPGVLTDPSGLSSDNLDLSGLVPCDPLRFLIGIGQDILGASAIAHAIVTEAGTIGLSSPVSIPEAAFGLYHIWEGQMRIYEGYHCD